MKVDDILKEALVLTSLLSAIGTVPVENTNTTAVVDITEMNIYEIQEAVDDGYLDYETIMKIYLERIETYNDKYNAVLHVNEKALEQAKKADEEYEKNGRKSMLFGLPILVKDNIDVKEMPTTAGTKALKDNYPKENSPAVQNIIDAGGIIIGKANMSEFALSGYNSYSSYGHVYNSYNTKYSSYGSSGGTAVGVAANFAVAGLGTDTGGSVRLPSAANNLVGLRPTWGSISSDGVIKYDKTRDTIGPITRYVEDNAILMDILAKEETNFEESLTKTKDLKGVRIGVATQFMSINSTKTGIAQAPVDRDIYNLMQKAINKFKDLGAEIVYINNFYNGYYSFNDTSFCYDFNEYLKGTTGTIRSWQQLKSSKGFVSNMNWVNTNWCKTDYTKSSLYQKTLEDRNDFTNSIKNKFTSNNVDIVIYPTIRSKLSTASASGTSSTKTAAYTITATGYPSMNIQIGSIDGLYYGMEMVTLANNEEKLYSAGYLYQGKTNYYKNPTIAKSLYKVSDELKTIKVYYDKENKSNNYEEIDKITESYLKNYSQATKSSLKENTILSIYNLINKNEKV